MWFDEDGIKHYNCPYCQDMQWVHQRNPETGLVDYSLKAVRCKWCKDGAQPAQNAEQTALFQETNNG